MLTRTAAAVVRAGIRVVVPGSSMAQYPYYHPPGTPGPTGTSPGVGCNRVADRRRGQRRRRERRHSLRRRQRHDRRRWGATTSATASLATTRCAATAAKTP